MAQIKIDPDALREWEESRPESRKELAESIGRTTSVFSNAYARGEMNEVVLSFLCKTFGLPEDAFLPKEKTVVVQGGASTYHLTLSLCIRTGFGWASPLARRRWCMPGQRSSATRSWI